MSVIIFDNFDDAQSGPSSLASSGSTSWTPVPSTRTLFTGSGVFPSNLLVTVLGLTFDMQFLKYDYTTPKGLFNLMINLTSIAVNPFITSVSLSLVDTNNITVTAVGVLIGTTYTWTITPLAYPGLDLDNIKTIIFRLAAINVTNISFDTLSSTLTCLASNTLITLSDGLIKPISEIVRGDLIIDKLNNKINKVAKVIIDDYPPKYIADMLKFEIGSLGGDLPCQPLYISKNHPIVYNGARRPAYCFQNMPDVTYYKNTPLNEVLLHDQKLCDLQFEDDVTYLANGVIVQSRSPYSNLTPLPKELYFDQSLYTGEQTWDSLHQSLPLDTTIL